MAPSIERFSGGSRALSLKIARRPPLLLPEEVIMAISSIASAPVPQASLDAPATVVMAKNTLDQVKQDGQTAVSLIQKAAPPPGNGQRLSVYA